jgi:hypothetical protein
MRRTIRCVLVASLALVAALTASAAGAADTVPIGPGQTFVGLVNDHHRDAVVTVACPGPLRLGQTGHPTGDQSLAVRLGALPPLFGGFTGVSATSIAATFREDPSVSVKLTAYGIAQPIPTSLALPCGGSGRVRFTPVPTSRTARSDVVTVRYLNIAVSSSSL